MRAGREAAEECCARGGERDPYAGGHAQAERGGVRGVFDWRVADAGVATGWGPGESVARRSEPSQCLLRSVPIRTWKTRAWRRSLAWMRWGSCLRPASDG